MTRAEMRAGREASLEEILLRREERVREQRELLRQGGECLVSFTMNIPGARKRFPLASDGFQEGCTVLKAQLPPEVLLAERYVSGDTGDEAMFLLAGRAEKIKRLTVGLEERHPLGRLWDMDVLDREGKSLSRTALGLPQRTCLVCGKAAKFCARSRSHDMELLFHCAADLLERYFCDRAADMIAACAGRALLAEVSVTPKPGLVDRANSGSHTDMDYFTFLDSAAVLTPWFRTFFCLGWDNAHLPEAEQFAKLRWAGLEAERAMFAATGGVNTHKGLIFSMAVLCGAMGRARAGRQGPVRLEQLLESCARLGSCALADLDRASSETAGLRCYRDHRITGIRGEAAGGFPSVLAHGLPVLREWLGRGAALNDAAAAALLSLIGSVTDTNMIHRGGLEEAERRKREAAELLRRVTTRTLRSRLEELDREYIRRNLSPGGCADLLALTLMFHFLDSEGLVN